MTEEKYQAVELFTGCWVVCPDRPLVSVLVAAAMLRNGFGDSRATAPVASPPALSPSASHG